jgi:choline dehydrogenase-like flavoprotein
VEHQPTKGAVQGFREADSKWATKGIQMWGPDDGDQATAPEWNVNFNVGIPTNESSTEMWASWSLEPLAMHSEGVVRLRSKSMDDAPLINARYLEDGRDMQIWLRGLREAYRQMSTPTIQRLFVAPSSDTEMNPPFETWQEDAGRDSKKLEEWVRDQCAGTNGHPQGGNRMGADEKEFVVNSRTKVHGVGGLRVVDASAFPFPIIGNTNQPAVLFGLRAGTLLLEDHGLSPSSKPTPSPTPPQTPSSSSDQDAITAALAATTALFGVATAYLLYSLLQRQQEPQFQQKPQNPEPVAHGKIEDKLDRM